MIILLSPAKSLQTDPTNRSEVLHSPTRFDAKSKSINAACKRLSKKGLMDLMRISEDLAALNRGRFQSIKFPAEPEMAKPAILMFNGDVYRGLGMDTLPIEVDPYLQNHVRILSGLYGLLRPFDLIQAYRLEMGTKLEVRNSKNLYTFWGDLIGNQIREDLNSLDQEVIINLASNEYFKAIKAKQLDVPIIDINFKEMRNGVLKFISFNAKVARGLMTRFAAENSITNPQDLKGFDFESYQFDERLSSENEWIFVR